MEKKQCTSVKCEYYQQDKGYYCTDEKGWRPLESIPHCGLWEFRKDKNKKEKKE